MCEVRHTRKYEYLVYDVGMHKGEDTDYYLKKGFSVIGFEADPDLVALCKSKFSDEIENGKLIIVEGAIAELPPGESKGSTIKFYKNKDISVWGTVADDRAHQNELFGTSNEIIEVPVVDFSACLEKYGIPHYLKTDIEGMDILCLRSLMHFEQKPDYVSIESDKVSFGKLLEELNLLKQLGYTRFKAIQQWGISHQIEPNPSKENMYVGYQFQEGASGLFGEDLPYEWKDYKQILNAYKVIFFHYELFDVYKYCREPLKYFVGKVLRNGNASGGNERIRVSGDVHVQSINEELVIRKVLSKFLHKLYPGWYDTHAKHFSVVS
jgi:FkbM family methyltransferase